MAQQHNQLDLYADALGDKGSPEVYRRIAGTVRRKTRLLSLALFFLLLSFFLSFSRLSHSHIRTHTLSFSLSFSSLSLLPVEDYDLLNNTLDAGRFYCRAGDFMTAVKRLVANKSEHGDHIELLIDCVSMRIRCSAF